MTRQGKKPIEPVATKKVTKPVEKKTPVPATKKPIAKKTEKKAEEIVVEPAIGLTYGEALEFLKARKPVSRHIWKNKDIFVVYQHGYPNGIPCNAQTAAAWHMKEGELFRCEPYLQISTANGSHAMWAPTVDDSLANDWYVVE